MYPPHCARQAFLGKRAQWHASQQDHRDNRQPEIAIIDCYGVPCGAGQRPPYTPSTAFYFLAKHVEQFFQAPFYDSPGTRLEAVSMDDAREELRGEATVYADRDFGLWEIIGAYTGRIMTDEELATESKSLLMLNKRNDYIFAMKTRVTIDGDEEQLLVCPYPTYGNEMMAINDGKLDGKKVNCGWMEVLYRGWPYVFVVNISRHVIRQGDELLLDYSTGPYWASKAQMDDEQAGLLDALEKPRDRHGSRGDQARADTVSRFMYSCTCRVHVDRDWSHFQGSCSTPGDRTCSTYLFD